MDPIATRRGGLVATEAVERRSFSAAGIEVGLEDARVGSLALLVAGLLGLLVALASRWRAARRGEAALIAARHGRWLVPVQAPMTTSGRIVDVDSFDSLRRLAEHYGHMVLLQDTGTSHLYSVDENGVTYRYRSSAGAER